MVEQTEHNGNGRPPKPAALAVIPDGIPADLRRESRWLLWRYEWRAKDAKWGKVPRQANGRPGKSTDPATWTTFDAALAAYRAGGYCGLGFALGDGFAGVDLDDMRDPATGNLDPEAEFAIATLDTYCETSPSATGFKLFLRGTLPKGRKQRTFADGRQVECYDSGRYFCVTGHRFADAPAEVRDRQAGLERVHRALIADHAERRANGSGDPAADDREIALSALAALSPTRAAPRADWLAVGMALHSVDASPAMLAEWDSWSRSAPDKYADGACEAAWRSFSPGGGIGIGSLIHWAREDGWTPPRRNGKPRTRNASPAPTVRVAGGIDQTLFTEAGKTELANARRFLAMHRDRVRYCFPWKRWIVWDGCRWAMDDSGAILRLAMTVPDSIWATAGAMGDDELRRFACNSSKMNHLRDMLTLAAAEVPILPAELDAQEWLLNVGNGTIDLRTGELREHRREDNLTKVCPVDFDPDAEPFIFDAFLYSVFEPTPDVVPFLQRFLGYSITGSVREQLLGIFHGGGANGKTTLIEALTETIGSDYAGAAPKDLLMVKRGDAHPTEWADLHGKRLVVSQETEHARTLAESAVKQLTGADEIPCRRMREDWWRFKPQHQLLLVTNHRPRVKGQDHAIWRRLRLIPFNVRFEGAAKDKRMPERLRDERQAILTWLVRGAAAWFREGLTEPETVLHATAAYRASEDVVQQFVDECCAVADDRETKVGELFAAYEAWGKESGETTIGRKRFADSLEEKGFRKRKSNGVRFSGIGIR